MAVGNLVKRLQDIMRKDAGINGDAQRIEQMVWMFFLKVYNAAEKGLEYNWKKHDYVRNAITSNRWSMDEIATRRKLINPKLYDVGWAMPKGCWYIIGSIALLMLLNFTLDYKLG